MCENKNCKCNGNCGENCKCKLNEWKNNEPPVLFDVDNVDCCKCEEENNIKILKEAAIEINEKMSNTTFDFNEDLESSEQAKDLYELSKFMTTLASAVAEILMDGVVDVAFATKDGVEEPNKRDEDMGFDVKAHFDEHEFVIKPHETRLVPTGLYSALPPYFGLLGREKGSTGSIGMKLGAGVIDSGYRDEIFIPITNTNDVPIVITKDETLKKVEVNDDMICYPYKKGIAQLIVIFNPKVRFKRLTIDQLKAIPSERGEGKLGSTDNF